LSPITACDGETVEEVVMAISSNPIFWLICVNLLFFVLDFAMSAPNIKEIYLSCPRILQQAFVLPIAVPPCILPLFPQPRFEYLALPGLVAGVLCIVTSVILMIAAFRHIGVIPSAIPEEMRKGLITSGVYGVIRNPIYSAVIAMALGFSLAFRGLYGLAYVPIVFVLFGVTTLLEERELVEVFGDEYLEYKSNVPHRFIPGIV
jgi:protein-S-isoprenylcysteine O-methyltransferase Ste14